MKVETKIKLNRFKPRDYQLPLMRALERGDKKRFLCVWARRAGKDVCAFNAVLRAALNKVAVYYYVFPTYSQAKKVIWDSITNTGERFIDYIPPELVASKNSQEMKIVLVNNSLIQLVGSDNVDSLMGTNPAGVVFSEYAMQSPLAYQYLRPILLANEGWSLFISTPRGKNHFWELYNIALNNPDDWFTSKLSVLDTGHIPIRSIRKEIAEGTMSEDLSQQEYYVSFDLGVEGSYYSKIIDRMRVNGQIGVVPWEPSFKVHTAWDLGVRDMTSIIFFQVVGQVIRIIDCYEKSKEGLEHYVNLLNSKPYTYGHHFAPHDIAVKEWGSGLSRIEKAKRLGVKFTVVDNIPVMDGIEAVRSTLPKVWADEIQCSPLIKALENYRQEYDDKKKVYKPRPLHDVFSNFCFIGSTKIVTKNGDLSINKIKPGMMVKTPTGFKKVLKVHEKLTKDLRDIQIGDDIITCTPEHDIFTQRGLVKPDSLRYTDVLEKHSMTRSWVWKKIYGYYSKALDLKGFKKTILSLKMKRRRCLMGFFIGGMEDILLEARQQEKSIPCYTERYGVSTMERFRMAWSFITSIMTRETISSKTLKSSTKASTCGTTPIFQLHGQSLRNAQCFLGHTMQRQLNGIGVMKEESGIESMQGTVFQQCEDLNTKKRVRFAQKNTSASRHGKNTVVMRVKQKIESIKDWILSSVLVVFVKLYLHAINMLSNMSGYAVKHVVKNVRSYQCDTPKKVYDLTIDGDNCYYANGYLVSNSDAMRYLALSLPKTRDGMTPEDLDRIRHEALYGDEGGLPDVFRDNNRRFY